MNIELTDFHYGTGLELYYTYSRFSGYGNYTITAELEYKGERKEFSRTINEMPSYDEATDLEGDEKELAFYNLIAYKIEDNVADWMAEVDELKSNEDE